jgi:hypothetical protein
MFVFLHWKNRKGKELNVLFEESKAVRMADKMREIGVTVSLVPEEEKLIVK